MNENKFHQLLPFFSLSILLIVSRYALLHRVNLYQEKAWCNVNYEQCHKLIIIICAYHSFLCWWFQFTYLTVSQHSEFSPEKALKWSDRLAILIGIAKAVHFLHTGVIPGCFRNQLRTNNILLDEHHIPKLSDYGMSLIRDEIEKFEVHLLSLECSCLMSVLIWFILE